MHDLLFYLPGRGEDVLETLQFARWLPPGIGFATFVPAPDYPLWTAAVSLSGGTPVHYICDESNEWMPDPADIRARITPHTKGIVIINPNNPTGALYSDELLLEIVAIAREHG